MSRVLHLITSKLFVGFPCIAAGGGGGTQALNKGLDGETPPSLQAVSLYQSGSARSSIMGAGRHFASGEERRSLLRSRS